ncbi:MAG: serine/threonine-protein phosphatase [Deltaproteobacteria bacterium]|nr:serine/threonine-protein phosphatase [Deltaproteobacteria bacterium]
MSTGLEAFALSQAPVATHECEDAAVADADLGVFAVADGVSGRFGGATASRLAVASFVTALAKVDPVLRIPEEQLRQAVSAIVAALRSAAAANPALASMATTLSAVVLREGRGKVVHVGDGRIYRLGVGGMMRLTRDHTIAAELVERHHLKPDEALHHPLRHTLSRWLETSAAPEPDIVDVDVAPGEWLLIGTDGLWNALNDRLVDLVTLADATPEAACQRIVAAALPQAVDDVTVVAVRRVAA